MNIYCAIKWKSKLIVIVSISRFDTVILSPDVSIDQKRKKSHQRIFGNAKLEISTSVLDSKRPRKISHCTQTKQTF